MIRFKKGVALNKEGLALSKKGTFLFLKGMGTALGVYPAEEQPVDPDNVSFKDIRPHKISNDEEYFNGQEEKESSGKSQKPDEKESGEEKSESNQNSNKYKHMDVGIGAASIALGLYSAYQAVEGAKQMDELTKEVKDLRGEVVTVKQDVRTEAHNVKVMIMDNNQNHYDDEWVFKLNAPFTLDSDNKMSFQFCLDPTLEAPLTFDEQEAVFHTFVERLSAEERGSLDKCKHPFKSIQDIEEYLKGARLRGELPEVK